MINCPYMHHPTHQTLLAAGLRRLSLDGVR